MLLTPFPEYKLSARVMNNYHLCLSLRVLRAINSGIIYPKGFSQSPAVALWRDHQSQLLDYGLALLDELVTRRLPDPKDWTWIAQERNVRADTAPPFWLANRDWHRYHREIMFAKDPAFYNAMFVKVKCGSNFADNPYSKDDSLIFSDPDTEEWKRARIVADLVNHPNRMVAHGVA